MTHPLKYVTVKGNVSAFVPDGMDPDDDPDEVGVTGSVRFTLQLNNRDAVLMPHHPAGPTIRVVQQFDVPLDSNGDLSHRGKKFVKLPALDEWTSPQVARYRVDFVDLRVRGERVVLRPLEIPAVPDTVVDLANEFPVPGSPAPGVTRGPQGDSVSGVRVEGSSLVFSVDTDPVTDLPAVPLPAIGELADAADVAVAASGVAVGARDDAVESAGIALASAEFADSRASAADASAVAAAQSAADAADVVPQATVSVFGKVKLAGDLAGTAAAPTVPALAVKADLVGGKVPAGQLPAQLVTSVAGRQGAVTLAVGDVSGAAPLASPQFTGSPAVSGSAVVVASDARLSDARDTSAARITDATATGRNVLKAADAAAARSAIGAGTSSLALGSTSSTAMPGDRIQAVASLPGSPTAGVLYCIPG